MLAEGKLMRPAEALQLKLVDELVADRAAVDGARARLDCGQPGTETAMGPQGIQNTRRRRACARRRHAGGSGPCVLTQKTRGLYPAPEAILSCAVEAR